MDASGPFGNSPNIGVGFSDTALVLVSVFGFIMLATTVYSVIILRVKSKEEIEREMEQEMNYDERLDRADVATLNRAQRRARAKNIMKRQRRVAPAHDEGDDADQAEEETDDTQHLSRKEREKLAKAAERKERRLFEAERLEQQREAQEAAHREKLERERQEAERLEEKKRQRAKEKQARQHEEYQQWKTFLSSSDGSSTMSVEKFHEMAREQKIVGLDDLADRFGTPTQQIEERIRQLVASRRLTGVIDPASGQFVWYSTAELSEIARQVVDKGDVDKSAIAQIANAVIESKTH